MISAADNERKLSMLSGRERRGATSYRAHPAYLSRFAVLKIQGLDLERR